MIKHPRHIKTSRLWLAACMSQEDEVGAMKPEAGKLLWIMLAA